MIRGGLLLALCLYGPSVTVTGKTADVEASIGKGRTWLLSRTEDLVKGSEDRELRNASLELVVLALAECGVSQEDENFSKLTRVMVDRPLSTTREVALQAMALRRLDVRKYHARLIECAQFLVDRQCENGQWGRARARAEEKVFRAGSGPTLGGTVTGDLPRITVRRTRQGGRSGDHLSSSYAALGLRACLAAGVQIERDVVTRARLAWNQTQRPDGGWGGNDEEDKASSGLMTVSAISATAILKSVLGEDYRKTESLQKAWQWLKSEFTVKENPGQGSVGHFFYLSCLERAAALCGVESIGEHSWHSEGAAHVVGRQEEDGHWSVPDLLVRDPIANTCYALLFLRHGTEPLPAPLPKK